MPPVNPPGPLPLLVIPGVDPNAPINSQIDQIDQQITFMLQDIDANFAKIHHVVTEKIIPSLKKFDADTQPVKEAAKFWRSFFEAAAQIQVAPADVSTVSGAGITSESYTEQDTIQDTITSHTGTPSANAASFLGPAVSSTPLPGTALSSHHISLAPSDLSSRNPNAAPLSEEEASWAASVESPFTKLDRQLRDDLKMDENEAQAKPASVSMLSGFSSILTSSTEPPDHSPMHATYHDNSTIASSSIATIQAGPSSKSAAPLLPLLDPPTVTITQAKGKSTDPAPQFKDRTGAPLLRNVLKTNAFANQRTPRAQLNPFSPAPTKKWNGIADLRHPSPGKSRTHKTPKRGGSTFDRPLVDSDSSDDDLPPGMSPPVTMNFTLPAKKLLRTPAKEVARMAVEGLTRGLGGDTPSPEVEHVRDGYGWEESSARIAPPTPARRQGGLSPAKARASKVHVADHSLVESLGLPAPAERGTRKTLDTPGRGLDALLDAHVDPALVDDEDGPAEEYDDSSFEDFGSPPTGAIAFARPSAAAAHGNETFDSADSSFSSTDSPSHSSSLPPGRPITVDDPLSDSSDSGGEGGDGEEETVFGVGGKGKAVESRRKTTDFELLGRAQDEMTVHGGHVDEAVGVESPTPWR